MQPAADHLLRYAKWSLRDHHVTTKPSEHRSHRFPAAFVTDHDAIATREWVGVHCLRCFDDSAHITANWPYAWNPVNAALAGVPADERHAILAVDLCTSAGFGD